MTTLPKLTDQGNEIVEKAVDNFHSPLLEFAKFPNIAGKERNILHALLVDFTRSEFPYDRYAEEDALELLNCDMQEYDVDLDVEAVIAENEDFEFEVPSLGEGAFTLSEAVTQREAVRDEAVVLRFYQSLRNAIEEVLDMDPGSSTWEPEEAKKRILA